MEKKRNVLFQANQLDIFNKRNLENSNLDLAINEQTELLSYNRYWEFPREGLK